MLKTFWQSPRLKPWRLTLGVATVLACASFWPRFWLTAQRQSLKPWNGRPMHLDGLRSGVSGQGAQSFDKLASRLSARPADRALLPAVAPTYIQLDAVIQSRVMCHAFSLHSRRRVGDLVMALIRPMSEVRSVRSVPRQACTCIFL